MNTNGFTLIETMVAIAILMLAISGAFMTANSSMVAAQIARDQLTASYLAQEGIEYTRMVRDTIYLGTYEMNPTSPDITTNAWTAFQSLASNCNSSCTLDPWQPNIGFGTADSNYSIQPSVGNPLYLTDGEPFHYTEQTTAGSQTIFTRTIQTVTESGREEEIISTVSWNFHGSHSVTITDNLTGWQ